MYSMWLSTWLITDEVIMVAMSVTRLESSIKHETVDYIKRQYYVVGNWLTKF